MDCTKTIFGTMLSLTNMDIWAASPGDLDTWFIIFLCPKTMPRLKRVNYVVSWHLTCGGSLRPPCQGKLLIGLKSDNSWSASNLRSLIKGSWYPRFIFWRVKLINWRNQLTRRDAGKKLWPRTYFILCSTKLYFLNTHIYPHATEEDVHSLDIMI